MQLIGSLRLAASSLLGHVVGFALLYSVPPCVTFLAMSYNERTLDAPSALWIVSVCGLTGIIVAMLFWYIVSRPLIKRRKDRS